MADASYPSRVYRDQSGNLKVPSGAEIDVESGGALKIGGTQTSATAAEIDLNDGKVASFGFAAASGAANVSEITITPKDAAGSAIADTRPLLVWLSDDSDGVGLTSTSASGTVQAKSTEGTDMGVLTAKKCVLVQPKAAGTYVLEITDTNKTTFYVAASNIDGTGYSVSAQLATGDYG